MKHIAIDLGASNGRIIVGDSGIQDDLPSSIAKSMEVVHRFPSHTVELPTGIHWNLPGIYSDILQGLKIAFGMYKEDIVSIGIDSWGVDFSLLDIGGEMMFLPYHYRDKRTDGIPQEIFDKVISPEELFRTTGVQIMQLNTIFQLYAMNQTHPGIVTTAEYYLSIPDLLTFWLTGEMICERTHASTTGLFNPSTGDWAWDLIEKLSIPSKIFRPIVSSGTIVGELRDSVRQTVGASDDVQFIASASHDTQSAAYTIGKNEKKAFLSCGTWSIVGLEQEKPNLSSSAFENDFSNEASGYSGFNLLKNIVGLWILQECKAEWEETREGNTDNYKALIEQASACAKPNTLIDVNDSMFLKTRQQAGSMTERINEYIRKKGGEPCKSIGEFVRVILESLAEYYANTLNQLIDISKTEISELYLIGGGAQNSLLADLTAEKTGLPVRVGEAEATAIGNIMIQCRDITK